MKSQRKEDPAKPLHPALQRVDRSALPRHLAIIMDGNGRWAEGRGLSRIKGHQEGAESVHVMVRACAQLGIEVLTLYAFSEENWGRPAKEVAALMKLLPRYLTEARADLLANGIRLRAIGDIERLPSAARMVLKKTTADTAAGRRMTLVLALSYGGRQEVIRAVRALCRRVADGELKPEQVDQAALAGALDTAGLPDPDFLIRTSGEERLSNFLLWQAAYAEFHFSPVLWPDFREAQLAEALAVYAGRQRRFGLTGDQAAEAGDG